MTAFQLSYNSLFASPHPPSPAIVSVKGHFSVFEFPILTFFSVHVVIGCIHSKTREQKDQRKGMCKILKNGLSPFK